MPITAYRGKTFEELHEAGAKEFGMQWVKLNAQIVSTFWALDIDPSTATNRLLGTALAYKLLSVGMIFKGTERATTNAI